MQGQSLPGAHHRKHELEGILNARLSVSLALADQSKIKYLDLFDLTVSLHFILSRRAKENLRELRVSSWTRDGNVQEFGEYEEITASYLSR